MSSLRIIKFTLQDIFRNLSLSFMTVLILILMLLSVNIFLIVRVLTQEAIASIENQIDVSIYFNPEATEDEIDEIKEYINSFPEVVETIFLTKDEVLKDFQSIHEYNEDIAIALDELDENPLGPTLIVKTRNPKNYEKIITAINIPEYESTIEAKTFGDTEVAIEKISMITSQVKIFSIVLASLFGLIAFIIIFNTIRVAIYTQRSEISIKRLVGATRWFIRGPYILQALLFTIISVIVSYAAIYYASTFIDEYIELIFQQSSILTNYFTSNILLLLAGQFAAVFILTLLSSSLATRKYLRV